MSEEQHAYEVWLTNDAEHPGDEIEEEFVCRDWNELKQGLMSILADLEDKPHRAGILITVAGKPPKDEL